MLLKLVKIFKQIVQPFLVAVLQCARNIALFCDRTEGLQKDAQQSDMNKFFRMQQVRFRDSTTYYLTVQYF